MHPIRLFTVCFVFTSLAFTSCQQANALSDTEKQEGWQLLFDGKTINGWHMFNRPTATPAWSVMNGELTSDVNEKTGIRGDIITDKTFENYDLVFEWKIARQGNSGVFINVHEDTAYMATWATGPEYQLLDNANMKPGYLKDGKHSAGALYGMTPLKNNVEPKPFGQWNQSRILQNKGKISFWLNGTLTAEEDIHSGGWTALVAGSSLGKFADFGKATQGHIGLQDWAQGVSFRNIKIRELK